ATRSPPPRTKGDQICDRAYVRAPARAPVRRGGGDRPPPGRRPPAGPGGGGGRGRGPLGVAAGEGPAGTGAGRVGAAASGGLRAGRWAVDELRHSATRP